MCGIINKSGIDMELHEVSLHEERRKHTAEGAGWTVGNI